MGEDAAAQNQPFSPIVDPKAASPPRPLLSRLAHALDLVLVNVPDDSDPGLPALGLVLIRLIAATLTAVLLPAGVLLASTPDAPALLDRLGPSVVLVAFALVLELNRYGFVRRAEAPKDALILFTTMTLCTFMAALIASGAPLVATLAVAVAEIAASSALLFGLPFRKDRLHLLTALVVVHAAVLIAISQWTDLTG